MPKPASPTSAAGRMNRFVACMPTAPPAATMRAATSETSVVRNWVPVDGSVTSIVRRLSI